MFGRNGVMLGGMFNQRREMPAPSGWPHYVLVDDVNRAVEAVKHRRRPGAQRADGSTRRRLDLPVRWIRRARCSRCTRRRSKAFRARYFFGVFGGSLLAVANS